MFVLASMASSKGNVHHTSPPIPPKHRSRTAKHKGAPKQCTPWVVGGEGAPKQCSPWVVGGVGAAAASEMRKTVVSFPTLDLYDIPKEVVETFIQNSATPDSDDEDGDFVKIEDLGCKVEALD